MKGTTSVKICIDLDETLVNLLDPLRAAIEEKLGRKLSKDRFETWEMSHFQPLEREIALGLFEDESFMMSLKPIPRAQKTIRKWKKQGHKLWVVTHRSERLKRQTEEVVMKLFPEMDGVIVTRTKKGNLVGTHGFDVAIDDAPHILESFFDTGVTIYMISNELTVYNHGMRGHSRIKEWVPSIADVAL